MQKSCTFSSWNYLEKRKTYVGESKIIRTLGTCFAVGYTAGWSWQNTHGLLLSYHCGAGVTLIVHFCHEFFCHKHGHSQFHLHQRRAEGSDPFLWAGGVSGVEMHKMMSVQYGNNVMSQQIVWKWNERFKNGRSALRMGKEPDASPHPLLMQTFPTLLKTLKNLTLRYWSIPCIVLTLHLQTHLFGPLPLFF